MAMSRKAAGLTAAKVRTAKPGRYGDGNGLYLFVRSVDARFWVFRPFVAAYGTIRAIEAFIPYKIPECAISAAG
jgi:hypothetical protein